MNINTPPRHRRPSQAPLQLRVCLRCGNGGFDPHQRDVSDWPILDDLDASEHCRSCWFQLAQTLGRPLGQPRRS